MPEGNPKHHGSNDVEDCVCIAFHVDFRDRIEDNSDYDKDECPCRYAALVIRDDQPQSGSCHHDPEQLIIAIGQIGERNQ